MTAIAAACTHLAQVLVGPQAGQDLCGVAGVVVLEGQQAAPARQQTQESRLALPAYKPMQVWQHVLRPCGYRGPTETCWQPIRNPVNTELRQTCPEARCRQHVLPSPCALSDGEVW